MGSLSYCIETHLKNLPEYQQNAILAISENEKKSVTDRKDEIKDRLEGWKKTLDDERADVLRQVDEIIKPRLAKNTKQEANGNLVLKDKNGIIYESSREQNPVHGLMLEEFGLKADDVIDRGIIDENGDIIWAGNNDYVGLHVYESPKAV